MEFAKESFAKESGARGEISAQMRALCAELGPEDGVDPRKSKKRRQRSDWSGEGPNRKTLQLCKQVAVALDLALQQRSDDPVLGALCVSEVVPSPVKGRLVVRVASSADGPVSLDETLSCLGRVRGWLRSEVAEAIRRKRTPELTFEVVS